MSISYPCLYLSTPLFCYSISSYAYSYPISYYYSYRLLSFLYSPSHSTSYFHSFSCQHTLSSPFIHSVPVLFFSPYCILSHSILPHYSTPILIHPLIILPIHSFPHHPLSPILFSFHPSSISISTPLSYTLLPLSFTNTLFYSILYFYSPLCSQTPIYYHSTPLTASPHPSLYHYPLPHSFAHTPFCSFSSLLSFVLSTRTIFFTIPIHFPIIYLFQSLLPPYH